MKYGILVLHDSVEDAKNMLDQLNGVEIFVSSDEKDTDGLPHDSRIHAGTKSKNADGRWKKKKGVDDATIATVESELRTPSAPAAFLAPTVTHIAPVTNTVAEKLDRVEQSLGMHQPQVLQASVPAPTPPVPPAPVAPPAPTPVQRDFTGLMAKINALFRADACPMDYPNKLTARITEGFKLPQPLNTITEIAHDPRMVDYAWQCIDLDTNYGLLKAV